MITTNDDDLLLMADKWRDEGRVLRAHLIEERDVLAKRVAEIDKRLAALPPDPESPTPPAQLPPQRNGHTIHRMPRGTSIPDLVRVIVSASTRPLSAREVIEVARVSRPTVKETDIHSAIYRLRTSGEITTHGDKGSWTYSWEGLKP